MTSLVDRFIHKYGRLPTERDPDYLEMLRMSKYRVVPVPMMKPGKCSNCGSTKQDGRGYVDFGLDLPWWGIVYLCTLCLHDIASNTGLYDNLRSEINTLKAKLLSDDILLQQGSDLQGQILTIFEEVKEHFNNLPAPSGGSDSARTTSVGVDETATDKSTTDETESGSSQPSTSPRREDLPSFTELLNSD